MLKLLIRHAFWDCQALEMIEVQPITGMFLLGIISVSIWSLRKMFWKIYFWQLNIVRKPFRKISKARGTQGDEQFEE
jgi:hypothetical protein